MIYSSNIQNQHSLLEDIALPAAAIATLIGTEIVMAFQIGSPVTGRGFLTYGLEILTFYINLYWITPLLFTKGRQLNFLARLVVLIVFHHILGSYISFTPEFKTDFITFVLSAERIILSLWRVERPLYVGFLIVVLKTIADRKLERQRLQLEVVKAREERTQVESTMAQMQLSPHLLMNGLTYIQAQVEEVVPKAGEAIALMADMLEASLVNINSVKKVTVAKAICQVKNRIAFHKLLCPKAFIDAKMVTGAAVGQYEIPPSLLMPAVENLLKYGDLNRKSAPARLFIGLKENLLTMKTWNLKKPAVKPGTGLGLVSMRRILRHYYMDRHTFAVDDSSDEYMLCITIEL